MMVVREMSDASGVQMCTAMSFVVVGNFIQIKKTDDFQYRGFTGRTAARILFIMLFVCGAWARTCRMMRRACVCAC